MNLWPFRWTGAPLLRAPGGRPHDPRAQRRHLRCATIHFLEKLLNRKPGGSTGTNVYAAFQIMAALNAQGHTGSVVSMLCDPGDRYLDSYYNEGWLKDRGFELKPYLEGLERSYDYGKLG